MQKMNLLNTANKGIIFFTKN